MSFYWVANREICHRDSALSLVADTAEKDGGRTESSNMAASEKRVLEECYWTGMNDLFTPKILLFSKEYSISLGSFLLRAAWCWSWISEQFFFWQQSPNIKAILGNVVRLLQAKWTPFQMHYVTRSKKKKTSGCDINQHIGLTTCSHDKACRYRKIINILKVILFQ